MQFLNSHICPAQTTRCRGKYPKPKDLRPKLSTGGAVHSNKPLNLRIAVTRSHLTTLIARVPSPASTCMPRRILNVDLNGCRPLSLMWRIASETSRARPAFARASNKLLNVTIEGDSPHWRS